jgi:hypothetical protein
MAERKAHRIEKEKRLISVEDALVAGLNPARIERELSAQYGVSARQIRKYIAEVYRRWADESLKDAPTRREKLIRMVERVFAKALAKQKFGAAVSAAQLLAKLGGTFARRTESRPKLAEVLGPAPVDDPTKGLQYMHGLLLLNAQEVFDDPEMDPERRYRLLSDMVAKAGMTYSKDLMQQKLHKVIGRLGPATQQGHTELEALDAVARPPTARGPRRDRR